MKNVKIDNLFAAWMLTEILYEKKLINDATIEAIRQRSPRKEARINRLLEKGNITLWEEKKTRNP